MRSRCQLALALALSVGRASTALAEPPAPAEPAKIDREATAQALYASATALMDDRRFDEACPKLEEVTRLIPEGIGAHITLAQCYEGQGRTASAWSEYLVAASAARRAGQPEREAKVAERIAELEPRLSRVTVNVSAEDRKIAGFVVKRDGIVVGDAQFGEAIPIDPGEHVVEATAPGKVKWERRVAATPDAKSLVVNVDRLADAPSALAPAPKALRPWQLPLGLALGGVGLAAAGVGFGLGGVALGDANDAKAECDAALACSAAGLALRTRARTFADAATGLLVAGGALTVVGIVVAATAPSAPRASVAIGLGVGQLDVHGAF